MRESESLFVLIKALKKSEKRFFKMASALQRGDKNYIKLFDAIDSQAKYNEEAVIKVLKDDNLKISNLSTEKVHLYNLILKSLEAYNANTNVDIILRSIISRVEILHEKELYVHSKKQLIKAKNMAYRYGRHIALLEILKWEEVLNGALRTTEQNKNWEQGSTFTEVKTTLGNIENETDYYKVLADIYTFHFKHFDARNIKEAKTIKKLINQDLLRNEHKAITTTSRIYFYSAHSLYNLMKNDFKTSYKYQKKLVSLIKDSSIVTFDEQQRYVTALGNLALNQLSLRKYDELYETIETLRAAPAKSESLNSMIFQRATSVEINMYLQTGKFEEGIKALGNIEDNLDKYKNRIDFLILYYNIGYMYFGAGQYNEANKWINRILNESKIELRQDAQCFARILGLIIHFELNNNELMEYMVKSTYRFLYKRKRLYQFENSFLVFIRTQLPKITSNKDLINTIKILKEELLEVIKDPYEKKVLGYFDFIAWFDSKIQNRPFSEIVKERVSS